MRKSILLLVLVAMGCGAGESAEYAVVDDFLAKARPLSCQAVTPGADVAAVELRSATDSTFLVLDEAQRKLFEFDHDLRLVWSIGYPPSGPGAIGSPVSATLLGDTAVVVADQVPLRLIVLSRTGEPIRETPLDFIPNSVEATPEGDVLITPMVMGPKPPTLLIRYDGRSVTDVPVPVRPYADMLVGAIGNASLVETLPDGSALLVHQFLSPRAFLVGADDEITPLRVPTPDATREQLPFVPTSPITEDQMLSMLLPGMGMSLDPLRSEVYLMTRSGRVRRGRPERAVLRLDDRLRLLDTFTLDVHATMMVLLPHRRQLIVVDDVDRFFSCPIPDAEPRHARAG